jgi:hypothetical protein
MAKRASGAVAESAPAKTATPSALVVKVRCFECSSATTLSFPEALNSPGATFGEPGWAVLSEPEDGRLVFACKSCFDGALEADGDDEDGAATPDDE